jgi:hypothetical protein
MIPQKVQISNPIFLAFASEHEKSGKYCQILNISSKNMINSRTTKPYIPSFLT